MTFRELHRAIKRGDVIALTHALDSGVSPDLPNRFGWTPLMLAALTGNTSVGELLIVRGAALDKKTKSGENALSLAAHKGHTPFIRLLLSKGAARDWGPQGHVLGPWLQNGARLPRQKVDEIMELVHGSN
jgi:ankyrin repeat protein